MSGCHVCGHPRHNHGKRGCSRYRDGLDDPFVPGVKWERCACTGYEDAVLPPPGEPLVFGVHTQRVKDAETAPVWPPLGTLNRRTAR